MGPLWIEVFLKKCLKGFQTKQNFPMMLIWKEKKEGRRYPIRKRWLPVVLGQIIMVVDTSYCKFNKLLQTKGMATNEIQHSEFQLTTRKMAQQQMRKNDMKTDI